jgi:hypothetical protein
MFFTPGELFNGLSEVTEGSIKAIKNKPRATGLALAGLNLGIALGTAKKGEVVQSGVGAAVGDVGGIIGSTIGGIIGAAIPIPGLSFVGKVVGGMTGYGIASSGTMKSIGTGLKLAKASEHLNIGGNYHDTKLAYTMRHRAAQELSGSLLNARHWLGSEGRAFH